LVVGGPALAAKAEQQFFFGDNTTADDAYATRDKFLDATRDVVSEGFEGQPVGRPSAPLSVFGGAGSLSQASNGRGTVLQGEPRNGRFNTTPGCDVTVACKWWETSTSFQVTLPGDQSAFGFFATDLGDLGGAINIDFWNDSDKVRSGVAVIQPTLTSGLLFFGYIDDTFVFDRVSVNVVQSTNNPTFFDGIGFDDLLAGMRATVVPNPVSAPATLGLVAGALGLLAATRRRPAPGG
jgi:hypothetical protein